MSEKSQEDKEYEYELIMENSARLEDLAMALFQYDDESAKRALAIALGSLAAHYEEPTLTQMLELATAQMETMKKQIAKAKSEIN